MATDVISNLSGSLDAELEKARETLRNVDDDIKKVFGKDASELTVFGRNRRGTDAPAQEEHFNEHFGQRVRRRDDRDDRDGDEPNEKRRRESSGAMGRLGPLAGGPPRFGFGGRGRDSFEGDGLAGARRLASRVVSSAKEKSRDEVLAEQRQDRSGRERNKRMFGALLGTLQRFKQDETKLKEKEDKRAQIEAKLDEAAKHEREEVKTKKQELIKERKLRLTEIKRIEVKRQRLAEMEQWEEKTKYLTNFIRTEAKPHIFYLPKVMNPIMECRLEQSKQYVTEMISHKRKIVLEDLEDYEQRSKRYWEGRMAGRTSSKKIDPMDADIEDELHEIMKHDDIPADEAEDFTVTVFTNEEGSPRKSETNGLSSRLALNEEEGKENFKQELDETMDDDLEVPEETMVEMKMEEREEIEEMNVKPEEEAVQDEEIEQEQDIDQDRVDDE